MRQKVIMIIFLLLLLCGCNKAEKSPAILPEESGDDWQLVWSDEFDGAAIDSTKWEFQIGDGSGYGLPSGWGNDELQWYTDKNAIVENGHLVITAKTETAQNVKYTSSRLRSINKGDWKYGRFEIRAQLPRGFGLWPAIWMLPTDRNYGGWAASGEIDIMEMLGHESDKVYGTLHYGGQWPENVKHGTSFKLSDGDFSNAFHTFCLQWDAGEMRWYLDGLHYQTQNEWYSKGFKYPAPFDQRFHLILNLAVGGKWPGNPDSSTVFPQKMIIDYVRVYKKV